MLRARIVMKLAQRNKLNTLESFLWEILCSD
jgi:hypothetical protein